MTEREYKFLLEEELFRERLAEVRRRFPAVPPKETVQINYYYDTPDGELRRQDITLRIRQTAGGLRMQLKTHAPDRHAYRRSEEKCTALPTLPDRLTLDAFPGEIFSLQGNLVTCRTRFSFPDGLRLDFDRNFYEGREDWELEMEFSPASREYGRRLLRELGLTESVPGEGKASRFFAAKDTRLSFPPVTVSFGGASAEAEENNELLAAPERERPVQPGPR